MLHLCNLEIIDFVSVVNIFSSVVVVIDIVIVDFIVVVVVVFIVVVVALCSSKELWLEWQG